MEQDQDTSSSGLGIDQTSQTHLVEAARWARFLAIVGFIVCGLIILLGIFAASIFSYMAGKFGGGEFDNIPGGLGQMMSGLYIGIAILYFIPCLFLFRFANYMKTAFITG